MRRLELIVFCCLTAGAQPIRLEKIIPLPQVEGRIDHLTATPSGDRLFIAALGNNSVEVVDTATGAVVHSIRGLRHPQGLSLVPETNHLYVANAADGSVMVFDATSFAPVRSYDFNSDADNVRFDAQAHELFVGFGDGALGVVNTQLGSRVGQITLATHPESFQLERPGPRIFINVPAEESKHRKQGHVTVIDRRSRGVVAKWELSAADNYPMALDETDKRLFIGCRSPAKLVVLDTASGKEVGSLDIVGDTDDVFYDAKARRIYVSGGGGAMTVISQENANSYQVLANVPTAEGARTSLFVPQTRRLYVAAPRRKKQGAALLVFVAEP